MKSMPPGVVECADGSVEIYESPSKKFHKLLAFAGVTLVAGAGAILMWRTHDDVLVKMRPLFAPGFAAVAIVSALLTCLIGFQRPKQPALAIKLTADGVTAGVQSARWSDVTQAYVKDNYSCTLLSRKAGEIHLFTIYLEISPHELLELVNGFRAVPEQSSKT
jgi:hypothetical protein